MPQPIISCRLCGHSVDLFVKRKERWYERCPRCHFIQVKFEHLPSREEERKEYLLHDNHPEQKGYRRFLSPVTNLALKWLQSQSNDDIRIVDFGAGSGRAIAAILAESGWQVNNYDPIFGPFELPDKGSVDLLICTEVVEHFHQPMNDWSYMVELLSTRGVALVMTEWSNNHNNGSDFLNWHYIREHSHVGFYHQDTFRWLSKALGFRVQFHAPRVVAIHKGKMDEIMEE